MIPSRKVPGRWAPTSVNDFQFNPDPCQTQRPSNVLRRWLISARTAARRSRPAISASRAPSRPKVSILRGFFQSRILKNLGHVFGSRARRPPALAADPVDQLQLDPCRR